MTPGSRHMRGRFFQAIMAITIAMLAMPASAQELNCEVEVNTSSIEGTDKAVFEELEGKISEYFNNTKWTDARFGRNEKIDCRFFLTVKEYSGGKIGGELQVQLSRPVYNSSYTTTLLNFKDTKVEFDFREGDQLVRNDNTWEGNLTGLLDFYAYLFLALDFDSFSPRGGQAYFDRAATVVQLAQSDGAAGWRTFDDNRNRSALLNAFTDPNTRVMRDLNYQYHRKGLDEMATSPDRGRRFITGSLGILSDVYRAAPMSVALPLFRDAKLDELVNVYSRAPQQECDEVYEILSPIFPSDSEQLDKIHNKAQE